MLWTNFAHCFRQLLPVPLWLINMGYGLSTTVVDCFWKFVVVVVSYPFVEQSSCVFCSTNAWCKHCAVEPSHMYWRRCLFLEFYNIWVPHAAWLYCSSFMVAGYVTTSLLERSVSIWKNTDRNLHLRCCQFVLFVTSQVLDGFFSVWLQFLDSLGKGFWAPAGSS